MKTLCVLRHGQTEWNAAGRLQGRLDSPLTELGRQQVQQHGRFLSDAGLTRLCVSPLGRTLESAHLLNSHLQLPLAEDDRLVERDCGQWSGLLISDIEKQFPQAWQSRQDDPYGHRPPGGENHADMRARLEPFLNELFESEHQHVAVMCHGIVSRVLLKLLLDLSPAQAVRVRHPNDIFYRLRFAADSVSVVHVLGGETVKNGLLEQRASALPASGSGASIPPSQQA